MSAFPELSQLDLAIDAVGGIEAFWRLWNEWEDEHQKLVLAYNWEWRARPKQLPPPGEWSTWIARCGRGWGKTLTGAEWIRWRVEREGARNIALVAPTAADARDVMVEGPSGILAISPPWNRPVYEPSKRRVTWPNGAVATTFSADEPRALRGPQHDTAWCVVGETMVTMGDGSQRRIDGLRPGDVVLTREGPKRVLASALTRRRARLWELQAADGSSVVGTGDHPVWAGGEFRKLRQVRPGAKLWTCQAVSCSTGRSSGSTVRTTTETVEASCSRGPCGSTIAAQSRKASSFTTLTKTSSTIASRTSRRCPDRNIFADTSRTGACSWDRKNGPPRPSDTGKTGRPSPEAASIATASTRLGAPTADGAARSAPSLLGITVSRVKRLARRADVYDIAVEDAGEFFANGILVHNCDELAHWRYLEDAWDNLQFGLRMRDARCLVTSSPRPLKFLRDLEADPESVTIVASTYENVRNLPKKFLRKLERTYEGTRLGLQEIYAEILTDNPNALWDQKRIDQLRVKGMPADLVRVVVAVDPAVTAKKKSDETGIIVAGTAWCRCRGGRRELHAFVFDDRSGIYKPDVWGKKVVDAYTENLADLVVAETNQGGDMVERNIRATDGGENIPYKGIHASRGKQVRHEPVANIYTQGKAHHVGRLSKLEDQQSQWDPTQGDSPDRLDACTYAITELMLGKVQQRPTVGVRVFGA